MRGGGLTSQAVKWTRCVSVGVVVCTVVPASVVTVTSCDSTREDSDRSAVPVESGLRVAETSG